MQRRITAVMVTSIVVALLLSGFGSVLLSRVGQRDRDLDRLGNEVEALAVFAANAPGDGAGAVIRIGTQVDRLADSLELDDAGALVIGTRVGTDARLPEGITAEDLDLELLATGVTQTGDADGVLFAAVEAVREAPGGDVRIVMVATRSPTDTDQRRILRWFLLSSSATLLVGILASSLLARRLGSPVHAATVVAGRIAEGDLGARLPEPPGERRDELSTLSRAINSMAESLERSKGLEQQFLLSVSHDLRTPLTNIRGYAEGVVDSAVEPAQAATVILAESRRLERLVADLLQLARLDARQFDFDLTDADLATLAQATVDGFSTEADAAGLTLTAALAPDAGPVPVRVDVDRIAQVLANLTENALKYARSSVVLSVRSEGALAVLEVGDDGEGIPAADLPHVFERLYVSGARPLRKESGSGLGLAIVHELVLAMGGTVTVTSTVGSGTSFRVTLPSA